MWLAKLKKRLLSEAVTFTERKCLYRAKTSLAKAKTLLSRENNVCNGENASVERKHHNRAKTAKMCLLSDISARKTRFCSCGRRFRSIISFSHFSLGRRVRATFSLGKSVFGFLSDVFVRKTRFRSDNAYLLYQRVFAFAFAFSLYKKRFRISEAFRSFCRPFFFSVKPLLSLRAKLSLGERVFAFAWVGNAKKFH